MFNCADVDFTSILYYSILYHRLSPRVKENLLWNTPRRICHVVKMKNADFRPGLRDSSTFCPFAVAKRPEFVYHKCLVKYEF